MINVNDPQELVGRQIWLLDTVTKSIRKVLVGAVLPDGDYYVSDLIKKTWFSPFIKPSQLYDNKLDATNDLRKLLIKEWEERIEEMHEKAIMENGNINREE